MGCLKNSSSEEPYNSLYQTLRDKLDNIFDRYISMWCVLPKKAQKVAQWKVELILLNFYSFKDY